jgi:hypothetical protein
MASAAEEGAGVKGDAKESDAEGGRGEAAANRRTRWSMWLVPHDLSRLCYIPDLTPRSVLLCSNLL